jgi:hypothetical protein
MVTGLLRPAVTPAPLTPWQTQPALLTRRFRIVAAIAAVYFLYSLGFCFNRLPTPHCSKITSGTNCGATAASLQPHCCYHFRNDANDFSFRDTTAMTATADGLL